MEKLNELIKDIEAVDNMYLDKNNVLKALKIAKKEITKQLPIQRVKPKTATDQNRCYK